MRNLHLKCLVAFCALICPALAWAQGGVPASPIYFSGPTGRPLAGAVVTVCTSAGAGFPCSPLASIFTNAGLSVASPNPVTTDGNGNLPLVFAAPGVYVLSVTGSGITPTLVTATVAGTGGGNVTTSAVNNFTNINNFTNAGVFTNTQMNQYLSSLVGGISANEFHNGGQPGFATEGMTGGVALPSSATVQNGNGIGGYCTTLANSNGRAGPNCVAMYGFSRILSTASAGAAAWGANFGSFSESGSTGGNIIGGEFDIGVGGTDSFVRGISVIGDWGHGVLGTVPANTIGYELFAQHGFKWPVGFEVDRGVLTANAQGFLCEGQNSANPTNSCGIAFRGYDGGGVGHQSSVSGDSAGNLVLAPALGTAYSFNNSGGGIGYAANTFASLGTPPNGNHTYCSDCTIANPCAGGGTGAFAKRLNGVWVCN